MAPAMKAKGEPRLRLRTFRMLPASSSTAPAGPKEPGTNQTGRATAPKTAARTKIEPTATVMRQTGGAGASERNGHRAQNSTAWATTYTPSQVHSQALSSWVRKPMARTTAMKKRSGACPRRATAV